MIEGVDPHEETRRALFLAVLTACALACPALAAEAPSPEATPSVLYPVEVLEYTEGDRAEPRISKTYELSPMDDPALIPTGDFERLRLPLYPAGYCQGGPDGDGQQVLTPKP